MMDPVLHPRIIENKDWATALFVLSLILIALTKSVFENRFNDFTKLIYSDKYIKMYRDSSHLMSGFTIALFVVLNHFILFFSATIFELLWSCFKIGLDAVHPIIYFYHLFYFG